eukprot:TRINITY_DN94791_c0_g1_i1.p1 TRINITY_DN94791_c0_g1~~TRINITY_DN94791_c0_g1_i1.p1  ORF type:complete len:399 (+),score=34.41 TRINITY_DN94791_c0_g1_i1:72-1268(+)
MADELPLNRTPSSEFEEAATSTKTELLPSAHPRSLCETTDAALTTSGCPPVPTNQSQTEIPTTTTETPIVDEIQEEGDCPFLDIPLDVMELIVDFLHTCTLGNTCTYLWNRLSLRVIKVGKWTTFLEFLKSHTEAEYNRVSVLQVARSGFLGTEEQFAAEEVLKLQPHFKNLHTVTLYPGCFWVTHDSAKQLIESLVTDKFQLHTLHLDLTSNRIGRHGVSFSAEGLHTLDLRLSSNAIGDAGIENLVNGLPTKNLKTFKIYLFSCGISDKGAIALGGKLLQCTKLCALTLYLGRNKIKEDGIAALVNGFRALTNLVSCGLYVENNPIGDMGIVSITNVWKDLPSISFVALNVENTGFTDELGGMALLAIADEYDGPRIGRKRLLLSLYPKPSDFLQF